MGSLKLTDRFLVAENNNLSRVLNRTVATPMELLNKPLPTYKPIDIMEFSTNHLPVSGRF